MAWAVCSRVTQVCARCCTLVQATSKTAQRQFPRGHLPVRDAVNRDLEPVGLAGSWGVGKQFLQVRREAAGSSSTDHANTRPSVKARALQCGRAVMDR